MVAVWWAFDCGRLCHFTSGGLGESASLGQGIHGIRSASILTPRISVK